STMRAAPLIFPLAQKRWTFAADSRDGARSMKRALGLVFSALFLSACGATLDDRDVCARAAAHVQECVGAAIARAPSCDGDAARELLALDCARLAPATGTRQIDSLTSTLGGVACAAGVVR